MAQEMNKNKNIKNKNHENFKQVLVVSSNKRDGFNCTSHNGF